MTLEELERRAKAAIAEMQREHRLLESGRRGSVKGPTVRRDDLVRVQTLCELVSALTDEKWFVCQVRLMRELDEYRAGLRK